MFSLRTPRANTVWALGLPLTVAHTHTDRPSAHVHSRDCRVDTLVGLVTLVLGLSALVVRSGCHRVSNIRDAELLSVDADENRDGISSGGYG
jgi:hypothetical protein